MVMLLLTLFCALPQNDTHQYGESGGVRYDFAVNPLFYSLRHLPQAGFKYHSPGLEIIATSGKLTVNGEVCGQLNSGDSLELLRGGIVKVNGETRYRLKLSKSETAPLP